MGRRPRHDRSDGREAPRRSRDEAGDTDVCEVFEAHDAAVSAARKAMLPAPVVSALADTFRALGDPTRVRILHALSGRELCVCDLAALLGMTSSAVSHQLRLLRHLRLVRPRKSGRMVYYSLDDDHVVDLFRRCLEHVTHSGQVTGSGAAGRGRPGEGEDLRRP